MPIEFRCTECGKLLRTPDDTAGREAKCPACGAVTMIPQGVPPVEASPESTEASSPFASVASPFGPADSSNPYRAPGEFQADLGADILAIQRVATPAVGLIVVGSIGLLLQSVGTVINLGMLGAGQVPPDDLPFALPGVAQVALGVLGIILSVLVIVGGVRMKRLENYGLAVTAAVVAIIPCFSPCCFLGMPFGIWALVVLLNSDVRAAFR